MDGQYHVTMQQVELILHRRHRLFLAELLELIELVYLLSDMHPKSGKICCDLQQGKHIRKLIIAESSEAFEIPLYL